MTVDYDSYNPCAGHNHLRATVDIPVERLITQDAVFRGNGDDFNVPLTFRFSVSFFGDEDIDLTAVRTT